MSVKRKEVMSLVRRLAGSPTVSDLEGQITDLRSKIAAAEARAIELDEQKLAVESDDQASKMDAEAERIRRLDLPRLARRVAELERLRDEARDREAAAAFERHASNRKALLEKQMIPALEQLRAAQVAAIAADKAARGELGEGVASHIPIIVFRGIALPDIVDNWIAEMRRLFSSEPRMPGRAPPPGIRHYIGRDGHNAFGEPNEPSGLRAAPKPTMQHAVVMDTLSGRELKAAVDPIHAPRLPDDDQPLQAGEVRAVVLRAGYSAPDGQSQMGRRVRLKRDIAIKAARGGAVTIVDDPQREEAERLSERTFRPVGSVSEAHGDPTIVGRQ